MRTRAMAAASPRRATDRRARHRCARAVTRAHARPRGSTREAEMLEQHAAGADSPKRSRPTTARARIVGAPTYLRQPSVAPASTATRATPRGSTLAR
jgi:hypothetical protein